MQTFSPVLLVHHHLPNSSICAARVCMWEILWWQTPGRISRFPHYGLKTQVLSLETLFTLNTLCFSSSKVLLLWSPFLYFPALLLYSFWKTISLLSLQQDLGREWKLDADFKWSSSPRSCKAFFVKKTDEQERWRFKDTHWEQMPTSVFTCISLWAAREWKLGK